MPQLCSRDLLHRLGGCINRHLQPVRRWHLLLFHGPLRVRHLRRRDVRHRHGRQRLRGVRLRRDGSVQLWPLRRGQLLCHARHLPPVPCRRLFNSTWSACAQCLRTVPWWLLLHRPGRRGLQLVRCRQVPVWRRWIKLHPLWGRGVPDGDGGNRLRRLRERLLPERLGDWITSAGRLRCRWMRVHLRAAVRWGGGVLGE